MTLKSSICILDYGSGNVGSVANISRSVCNSVTISNNPDEIDKASHLILPGVGSFDRSMLKVKSRLPVDILAHHVLNLKKPLLGICVGMQLMAELGKEGEPTPGLGWLNGVVDTLYAPTLKLPHIGWNSVQFSESSWFYSTFPQPEDFYFVHSYAMSGSSFQSASTSYGTNFISAIERENIFGVQFHPEKSQQAGQSLLKRFLEYPSNA
ncbi:MAG: imidazole glycerol phosphate synthase subunit HisH [Pseudomonadota bacterium]